MVNMKAPDGTTGCSVGGESYKVDKKGFVEVPEEAVADLMQHGFVIELDEAAAQASMAAATERAQTIEAAEQAAAHLQAKLNAAQTDKDKKAAQTALDAAVNTLADLRAAS